MKISISNRNVYVVSDIHNDADGFKKLLKEIAFTDDDILIIDGDIFDRGDKPIELYFEILKHPNIYVIQGNHDVWVKREIKEKFGNQKVGEYISYNTVSIMEKRLTPVDMLNIADWINQKPYYIELVLDDKLFHIAHAQVYVTTENVLDKQKIYMGDAHYDDFINGKNETYEGIAIVGHTATEDRKIWKSTSGRTIRIDCGNGYKCYNSRGFLAAIRLNDMKEFYV